MQFPSKAAVEARKARYKPGCRIEILADMQDPYANIPAGTQATVRGVDDAGQIMCVWDNGSTLSVIPEVDAIKLLPSVPDEVVDEILQLRKLPNCPNMFDIHAVQRLAYDNNFYSLVNLIENNRKAYTNFIITGERGSGNA